MTRSPEQLRRDALAIWQAGVDAVRADRLVAAAVVRDGDTLWINDVTAIPLKSVRRIAVVGAGKAGAGMAAGLLQSLGPELVGRTQLTGWINVPADCVADLPPLHLHAARPAGSNEPTAAGVAGAEQIMRIVGQLSPHDLCFCLISGGGSALAPLPVPGISLDDKLAVTRFLSGAGANIVELNTVRKQLSGFKGGGLARACRAGQLISLIISDVIGDPLNVIASGPTVLDDDSTPQQALQILRRFDPGAQHIPPAVLRYLSDRGDQRPPAPTAQVHNIILGNNAVAVDAAGVQAESLGYSHAMVAATKLEGEAATVGHDLARLATAMRSQSGPDCLITGGEPVVTLAPAAERGLGGRNQQLALAALDALGAAGLEGVCILSGGTDGEDGPTDAAGAFVDAAVAAQAVRLGLSAAEFLRRNDAYHFFEPLGALIKTGPTHTNVCDIRVVVVDRESERA